MQTLPTLLLALAVQALVAAALAALGAAAMRGRSGHPRRLRIAATLRRTVPFSVGLAAGSALLGLVARDVPTPEPLRMVVPGLATLAGAVATGGCLLVLAAGSAERRGRLAVARRLADAGGRAMFLGTAVGIVLWAGTFLALPGDVRSAFVASGSLAARGGFGGMLCGFGGFVGLLAGLSGKPRPSGAAAAVLYAGGLWLLFSAAHALASASGAS